MTDFSFQPVGGYAVVAAVAVVLALLTLVGPAPQQATTGRRRVLGGLRLAIFLLVVLAMLRPARVVTRVEQQPATVVILVDRSRSMQVADSFGDKSRWDELVAQLDAARAKLERLAETVEVNVYAFDAEVRSIGAGSPRDGPLQIDLKGPPDGPQTALGWAIKDVLRREAGKRLVAMVLLSDGAQRAYAPHDTPPQTAARRLADRGCPLYGLVFGQPRGLGDIRDIALSELLVNQSVYVKNILEVKASLRADGHAGQSVPVQLLFEKSPGEMEIVGATEQLAPASGQQLPVTLRFTPEQPGEYKISLRAPPADGELVTTNNQLSTFVTVLRGGINVLYLEGELRRERTFIGRALAASPNIQLHSEWIDKRTRSKWPVDPGDWFAPGKADVVILGDLDSAALPPAAWTKLAARVDAGVGLMMIGGFHSFGPGGYQRTALAAVLPVTMGRLEQQRFDEPESHDLHLAGPLAMLPVEPLAVGRSIVQLAAGDENRRLWRKLPPLDGGNRFRGRKPNAAVLLQSADASAVPLLVAGTWGGGRVLAFAGDTTWRWVMEGFENQHKRFWRQAVLWLARKDAATESAVWIKLDSRRFRPGGRVTFAVGVTAPHGGPREDVSIRAEVVAPDGRRHAVRMRQRDQQRIGSFVATSQAGDYAVEVAAQSQGEPVGKARARFLVFQQDLELDNPSADPTLVASLTRLTAKAGGAVLAPEQFPELIDELQQKPLDLQVEIEHKQNYWDTWPFFLAFVTLVGTEWYLRKRWGLV